MSNLLIAEPALYVLPSLAAAIGLNEAIFVQQLHYWLLRSKHERDGRVWVYNRIEDWAEQFPFWSAPTIRRIVNNLRASGIVIATNQYNKMPIDKTLWYTIDYEKVPKGELPGSSNDDSVTASDQVDRSSDQSDHSNAQVDHSERSDCAAVSDQLDHHNNQRLPETTTETTTDEGISGADAPPPTLSPDAEEFSRNLCWVCYGHKELSKLTERNAAQVRSEAAKLLDDGYTHIELRCWYADHWKKDWRYRKNGERPQPHQVREMIPIIRDAATKNPYAEPIDPPLNGFVSFPDNGPEPSCKRPQPKPATDDDPWARIVNNYRLGDQAGRGNGLSEHLAGSRLEAAGEVDGIPHYVIHPGEGKAAWQIKHHIRVLRMDLGIELGLRKVLLTVAQPQETPVEQPAETEAV